MDKLIKKEDGLYVEVSNRFTMKIVKLEEDEIQNAYSEWETLNTEYLDINEQISALEQKQDEIGNKLKEFNGVFDNWNPTEKENEVSDEDSEDLSPLEEEISEPGSEFN